MEGGKFPAVISENCLVLARPLTAEVVDVTSSLLQDFGARIFASRPSRPSDPSGTRAICSMRRKCRDHVVIFGGQHPRRLLNSYQQC
jgi:hypothetical protein